MKIKNTSRHRSKSRHKTIYLDNNSTTLICPPAKKIFNKYISGYNASSGNNFSVILQNKLNDSIDFILNHCNVNKNTHKVIFSSGSSESNAFAIRSVVKSFYKKTRKPCHVIASLYEHKSVLDCLEDIIDLQVSYIKPNIDGTINISDIKKEIKDNTCLITIMASNNEIPVINDIYSISMLAKNHNIPFHSDCVQIFGKYHIDLQSIPIDIISVSSHKFYGPKGVGLTIIRNDCIDSLKLTAEINGSQQYHLRGGTIDMAACLSTVEAIKYTFKNRLKKNQHLLALRNYTLDKLSENFKFGSFKDYAEYSSEGGIAIPISRNVKLDNSKEPIELISLGPNKNDKNILINTILLAVCKNTCKYFCNINLKNYLEEHGVIVSIGSACNTFNKNASHVLNAIDAPTVIKRGILRISFGDHNTFKEIDKFVKILTDGILVQCQDM